MAVGVTKVRRGEVADQKAAVCAVEDVLHQLQQAHRDLSFARPGRGEPLVHSALHTAGHPGNQRPGQRQAIQRPVGNSLRHVQVPTVAEEAGSVSTVLEQIAEQHLQKQAQKRLTEQSFHVCRCQKPQARERTNIF